MGQAGQLVAAHALYTMSEGVCPNLIPNKRAFIS